MIVIKITGILKKINFITNETQSYFVLNINDEEEDMLLEVTDVQYSLIENFSLSNKDNMQEHFLFNDESDIEQVE